MKCLKIWRGDDVIFEISEQEMTFQSFDEFMFFIVNYCIDFDYVNDTEPDDIDTNIKEFNLALEDVYHNWQNLSRLNTYLIPYGLKVTFEDTSR